MSAIAVLLLLLLLLLQQHLLSLMLPGLDNRLLLLLQLERVTNLLHHLGVVGHLEVGRDIWERDASPLAHPHVII